jgi:glycerate dehydrogenase
MSKFNIVFLDAATFGQTSLDSFLSTWNCSIYGTSTKSEARDRLEDQECAVVNKFLLDRQMLESRAARGLRLIAVAATGANNVDIDCARSRRIAVCNVSSYATYAVAQFTMALIFEMATRVGLHARGVRAGRWQKSPIFTRHDDHPSFELEGKVLGIVGYGNIGRKVAEMGRALGMEVLVSAGVGETRDIEEGRVPLDEVFARSDFLTVHCPLTRGTKGFVNRRTLGLMKPTAFLVNTARGELVDEPDLVEALEKKQLAGAALDVISEEPPSQDHPIVEAASRLENLWVTPHCAWATHEARHRLLDEVFHNIAAFLRGERRNRLD